MHSKKHCLVSLLSWEAWNPPWTPVRDVCAQFDREQVHVVPHIWDSNSSAGLQVVDYGLWAIQRHVLSGGIRSGHYNRFIQPKMADDVWYPWGTVEI